MPKTLYVSDLDGTLLDRRHRIPAHTADALNALISKGMLFTFATARSWHSAHVVTEGLSPGLPWIVHNGAMLCDGRTGERTDQMYFTHSQRREILSRSEALGLWPLSYGILEGEEKVFYLEDINRHPGMEYYIDHRRGDKRLSPVKDKEALLQGETYYFTFIHDREALLPLWADVRDLPWVNLVFQQELYQKEYWLEITSQEATKARAALRLKERLGCDRLVAFGDAMNDLPLFGVADESYAVENALPEVKEAATGVIGTNEQGGVARFLMERFEREGIL
ncbi:MAG: HAD family hydrolase [Acutalibacter muris]|nr:HAD family hydrolase [Acutalibacter muris]MCI9544909.1 HAD family hydrolase [Acutalibacter muris]